MPVNIIDTLKPKNGLNFPVVEAIDVFVEGFDNLADAVSHFATDVMIEAINAVLSDKANTSDVNTAVSGLQAQIDQIAQTAGTGTADTEIGQARVGSDGTSYNNLKARLDTENAQLNSEIFDTDNKIESVSDILEDSFELKINNIESTFADSKYIDSSGNIVSTSSYSTYGVTNYIDISNYSLLKIHCTSGYGNGFYAFYDNSQNYITGKSSAAGSSQQFDANVSVPSNAKYIVLAGLTTDIPTIGYIEKYIVSGLSEVEDATYGISEKKPEKNLINPDDLVNGYVNDSGTITPNTGSLDWKSTGYIEIYDTKNIAASKKDSSSRAALNIFFIAEYNENKVLINYTQTTATTGLFTLSSSAKYFRLSYHATGTEEAMLIFGQNTSEPYSPYNEEYKVKENALPNNIVDELDILNDSLATTYHSVGNLTITPNKLINKSNAKVIDYSNADYTIATYEIPEGTTRLAVTGSANWGNLFYIVTDENDNTVAMSGQSTNSGTISKITKEIVAIPSAGKYMIVANIISGATPAPIIYDVIGGIEAISLSEELSEDIEALIDTKSMPKHYWSNKKWVCVGDSLTEVNSRTTKHYHDYIAESTGITVVNMGVSGTGYKREEGNNNAFYQRIANVPLDADVVTIFGSGNDLALIEDLGTPTDTGTSTICGCINTTIDNLITLIPAVSLGIVAPTPWINNQPTIDDSNSMARYTEALREICKIRSIPFLDLYHCSNLRPWTAEGRAACYSKDDGNGVHPDETGHKLIAPRFKAFLDNLIL